MILIAELKSFEIIEKRRFESNIETEKSLMQARKEIHELKMHSHNLDAKHTELRDAFKTVAQEKRYFYFF